MTVLRSDVHMPLLVMTVLTSGVHTPLLVMTVFSSTFVPWITNERNYLVYL